MNTRSISRRYARALFELEQEGSDIHTSLSRAAQVVGMEEIRELLAEPQVSPGAKAAAAGKLSKEVKRLAEMLCARGKPELLPGISELVEEMIRQEASEVDAEVVTATKLDAPLQQKIAEALSEAVGRSVKLHVSQDASILGGLVVRIGDRQMDYSLRTRLQELKRALLS